MSNINANSIWTRIDKWVYSIFRYIFTKLLKKDYTEVKHESLMQFVKFGIVGVSNTVISYMLYAISLLIFQKLSIFSRFDYLLAQLVAFALSVLWSFYWNSRMVFTVKGGQKRCFWKALVKTYISYSFTGLFLNSFLLVLWINIIHISEFIAPIINLVISVPLNFLINKYWAFKNEV